MKPYDYVKGGGKKIPTTLQRHWIDEWGNSLRIENKTAKIILNDLSLKQKRIISTDLYFGLSLNRAIKMSKMIYLCAGKDEDLGQPCYWLTLVGLDNYARSYLYLYGEWKQVPTLLLGLNQLIILTQYFDLQYLKLLPELKINPIPCQRVWSCVSCLPATNSLFDEIRKGDEMLLPLFGVK
jgi:hypothetical protein